MPGKYVSPAELAAIKTDQLAAQQAYMANHPTVSLGSPDGTPVTLLGVTYANGNFVVYGQTINTISFRLFANSVWTAWTALPGPKVTSGTPFLAASASGNAVSTPGQFIYVYAVGADGTLGTSWFFGGNWLWTTIGNPLSTKVAGLVGVSPNGSTGVWVTGADGNKWCATFNGSFWGWTNEGASAFTFPIVESFAVSSSLQVSFGTDANGITASAAYTPVPENNTLSSGDGPAAQASMTEDSMGILMCLLEV